jgi:hypothetical protein
VNDRIAFSEYQEYSSSPANTLPQDEIDLTRFASAALNTFENCTAVAGHTLQEDCHAQLL